MEQLYYDHKPHLIALAGIVGVCHALVNPLAAIFGLILLLCGYMIFNWRAEYRAHYQRQYESLRN